MSSNVRIVADFKGYDVPYGAEGRFYYASLTNLVTVMAIAPNEVIQEANIDQKLVAFDLMSWVNDDWKLKRAQELADLGASLVSCHTGWSKRAAGKLPTALIRKVCQRLKNSLTQVIVRGSFKLSNIKYLKPYIEQDQIFAIAVGSVITRSKNPNIMIAQFLTEINKLVSAATVKESEPPPLYFDAHWAAIDELTRRL